jgi:hypothetical protein
MRNVKFKIQIELNKNQGEGGDGGYRIQIPDACKRKTKKAGSID